MGSTIDQSLISGPGTVDTNVLIILSIELTTIGVPLTFLTDFGISNNTSLGYQVIITPLGNTPVETGIGSLTGTGFTAYASVTTDCNVAVIRSFSEI